MNVLEIVPGWMEGFELLEHVRSLQTTSINLVLGMMDYKEYKDESAIPTHLSELPIPYYNLTQPSWRDNFRDLKTIGFSSQDRNLAHIIKKHKPDLVHFHFCLDAINMYREISELSIPFTVSVGSEDIHLKPLGNEDYLNRLCEMLKESIGIHISYDGLSSYVRQLCSSASPMTTIRLPIPMPDIILNPDTKNKHLISVGDLWWENGYHDLVRAIAYTPDLTLDIIGNGVDRRHLVFLIHTYNLQDRVRLLDDISFEQRKALIAKSAGYVHPGISQEASYYLLSAMALGKPVFATNQRGMDEIVEDQHNGIHIPIGEPRAMAEKFELLDDSDLMERLGKNARTTIEKLCAPDNYAEKVLQFYQNASKNTGR